MARSPLTTRKELALQHGYTLNGDGDLRNVYGEAGYPQAINFVDYLSRYQRQDIANRVVTLPATATWRHVPEVLDGDDPDTASDDTAFVKAWRQLDAGNIDDITSDAFGILHHVRQADIVAGIGMYSCLLLGIKDGADLSEPLQPGRVSGTDGLLYAKVLNESEATIKTVGEDPTDSRYCLPLMYSITTDDGSSVDVHWTRIVHVAEGGDAVYGVPRLRSVFNRLIDLDKIMAGTGEAGWRLLVPAYAAVARDGFEYDPEDEDFNNAIDEFTNKLRRWLGMTGMDITEFAGKMVDPSGAVKLIVAVISGARSIPQRLLLGSEAGQLASGQDEANWASYIGERQKNFAEPGILRPLIARLVYAGVLPKPTSGSVVFKWQSLIELSDDERANIGERAAKALATAGMEVVDAAAFVRAFFPQLSPEAVEIVAGMLDDAFGEPLSETQPDEQDDTNDEIDDEPAEDPAAAAGRN